MTELIDPNHIGCCPDEKVRECRFCWCPIHECRREVSYTWTAPVYLCALCSEEFPA